MDPLLLRVLGTPFANIEIMKAIEYFLARWQKQRNSEKESWLLLGALPLKSVNVPLFEEDVPYFSKYAQASVGGHCHGATQSGLLILNNKDPQEATKLASVETTGFIEFMQRCKIDQTIYLNGIENIISAFLSLTSKWYAYKNINDEFILVLSITNPTGWYFNVNWGVESAIGCHEDIIFIYHLCNDLNNIVKIKKTLVYRLAGAFNICLLPENE
jgi:hypothetical protein